MAAATKPCIFSCNGGGLAAYFETENCIVRSIEPGDLDACKRLFGDKTVVQMYMDGQPHSAERVARRVDIQAKRWKESDPYAALMVLDKATHGPMAYAVIGHGHVQGEADIATLSFTEARHKGYGYEVGLALFQRYLPELAKYTANLKDDDVPEGPLTVIHAVVHPDNKESIGLMKKLGMQDSGKMTEEEFNGVKCPRANYYYHLPKA